MNLRIIQETLNGKYFFDRLVPESIPWKHSCEGPDDMPAHAKACLLGSNLTLPICDGRVTLGTWQGVWLCEHRYDYTCLITFHFRFVITFHFLFAGTELDQEKCL